MCGIKNLTIDPVFSSCVDLVKKAPIINFSRISKSLKGIYFFFEVRNFSTKTVFFSV